jgi:hypothetical protein
MLHGDNDSVVSMDGFFQNSLLQNATTICSIDPVSDKNWNQAFCAVYGHKTESSPVLLDNERSGRRNYPAPADR